MARILSLVVVLLAIFATQNIEAFDRLYGYLRNKDIQVHPAVASVAEINRASGDDDTFNNWRCNDWYSMDWSFKKCLNTNETGLPPTAEVLHTLKYLCGKQRAVSQCMEEAFKNCENVAELKSMLTTTFSFCVGDSFPYVVELFLALHAGVNVTQDCLMSVIVDIQEYSLASCSPFTLEKKETLADELEYWDSLIGWYINCASTRNLDVFLEACELTRRQIYAILIASLQIMFGFGMNHYPKFEAFMQIP